MTPREKRTSPVVLIVAWLIGESFATGMSTVPRSGLARVTADKNPNDHIYVNSIELKGKDAYVGSSMAGGFCSSQSQYKIFVAGRFNQPFQSSAVWQDDSVDPARKAAEGKEKGRPRNCVTGRR